MAATHAYPNYVTQYTSDLTTCLHALITHCSKVAGCFPSDGREQYPITGPMWTFIVQYYKGAGAISQYDVWYYTVFIVARVLSPPILSFLTAPPQFSVSDTHLAADYNLSLSLPSVPRDVIAFSCSYDGWTRSASADSDIDRAVAPAPLCPSYVAGSSEDVH